MGGSRRPGAMAGNGPHKPNRALIESTAFEKSCGLGRPLMLDFPIDKTDILCRIISNK
jgi:hypothetical protein